MSAAEVRGRFDADGAARLDRAYASRQIVEQRRRLRAAVTARPGETGLDVGCGPGYLACELAREVTPEGRIVAIDHSDDMLGLAKARVGRASLGSSVEVRKGDAATLDFPDATFDFVVGAQVYCFIAVSCARSGKPRACCVRAAAWWSPTPTGACVSGNRRTSG